MPLLSDQLSTSNLTVVDVSLYIQTALLTIAWNTYHSAVDWIICNFYAIQSSCLLVQ